MPDGYDPEAWEGIDQVMMGLDPATWPTYGGITRGDFGDMTTPTIAANYPPSDAGNITLDTLMKQIDALPKFPKMPGYYRAHPSTIIKMGHYIDPPPDGSENFSGIKIVPDTDVPPGEFWPPEGWTPE